MIAGVDGCEGGWLVAYESDSGTIDLQLVDELTDVVDHMKPRLMVIDIPIGILRRSPRAADQAARRLLKRRSSCVFNAPIRDVLDVDSYPEANRLSRELDGKGFSRQGFALIPAVKEVDKLVRVERNDAMQILEGHPEVSFALMNGGEPVSHSKHTRDGVGRRIELLTGALHCNPTEFLRRYPRALRTDVLDSLALLWTARRIETGSAMRFPTDLDQRDEFGIRAAING